MRPVTKIVIPMAGLGSRMRPHTWNRPKSLLPLAGKTVLDYALDQFKSFPDLASAEYVFIISPNQGDMIQKHMSSVHPDKKTHYVLQEEMNGQSHALWLAREHLVGPMIMAFSDTLIETDLTFIPNETADAVAWVKPMDDPRRFGVIEINEEGWATHLIEKPSDTSNNLVLVGFYYFHEASRLVSAIEKQLQHGKSLNGEFYLAEAINIYIEQGAKVRRESTCVWLDAGIPSALLETNQYLLDQGRDGRSLPASMTGVAIIPPVSIAENVLLESAVIGPHVSIGSGCSVRRAVIRNSIVDQGTHIQDLVIENSILGRGVTLIGKAGEWNLGDDSRSER